MKEFTTRLALLAFWTMMKVEDQHVLTLVQRNESAMPSPKLNHSYRSYCLTENPIEFRTDLIESIMGLTTLRREIMTSTTTSAIN